MSIAILASSDIHKLLQKEIETAKAERNKRLIKLGVRFHSIADEKSDPAIMAAQRLRNAHWELMCSFADFHSHTEQKVVIGRFNDVSLLIKDALNTYFEVDQSAVAQLEREMQDAAVERAKKAIGVWRTGGRENPEFGAFFHGEPISDQFESIVEAMKFGDYGERESFSAAVRSEESDNRDRVIYAWLVDNVDLENPGS